MLVPGNPTFSLPSRLRSGSLPPELPLFAYARQSMVTYLDYLEQAKHRPIRRILLPDFMCHEVYAALRARGCEILSYVLGPDWDLPIDELRQQIEKIRPDAVFFCHFYGKRVSRLKPL